MNEPEVSTRGIGSDCYYGVMVRSSSVLRSPQDKRVYDSFTVLSLSQLPLYPRREFFPVGNML